MSVCMNVLRCKACVYAYTCVCVCVCVRVSVSVCMNVRTYVGHAFMHVRTCVYECLYQASRVYECACLCV